MNRFKTLTATALTMVLGLAAMGLAQTGPVTTPPPNPMPGPTAEAGALTEESLKTMLTNLGYAPTESKGSNGNTLFYIKVTRGNTEYSPFVCLSPSKTKIWVQAYLGDMNADEGTRALKLLELNLKTGPSHFVYTPADKKVYLFSPRDNRGFTPKDLKEQIETMLDHCESTKEFWMKPATTTKVDPK
jgi:hypothetical protein